MEFENKVVVITGGAQGIGKAIGEQFRKEGALVEIIDVQPNPYAEAEVSFAEKMHVGAGNPEESNLEGKGALGYFQGDLSKKEDLEAFVKYVIQKHGHVDVLVNNALPKMVGINEGSYEEFQYALAVGVTAPFYLAKLFKEHFAKGACIINMSSSRDRMSQPQTESYSAAKGGIASLTHALAVSLGGKVRVNSISPGWIDTDYMVYEGPDAVQQPAGRVGHPLDIAHMVLFLCSEKAGFITGENICIDGGMTKQMIYHGDHGWNLEE
ncbi:MAG: SDR family oxidoreductase [Lachnospiraceae bacterium]|nr:SDR family oxidoreductase [Lachnospiraceae bacterium]